MSTPPKAPCHSCNGTGIDPVTGFLDCEFCMPAFTGVSPSAPEQPEPKCAMCNGHGEIGCLRPDGYDGEPCPDCNSDDLDSDLVAIVAALQQRLTAADERADHLESGIKWEAERNALLLASLTEAEDMLSVTSLEAGQRIDVLEGLLRDASTWIKRNSFHGTDAIELWERIDAALKPADRHPCPVSLDGCDGSCAP